MGYFHIDSAEVRTRQGKLYLFVTIDRTSKFAVVQLVDKANRTTASAFLKGVIAAVSYKIHTIPTDNGIQLTFPPRYRDGPTARYVTHLFAMCCQANNIEYRLTQPNHPWTNGQVERMNRILKDTPVKRYYYDSHDQLKAHLSIVVMAYHFARRLKTLTGLTPYEYVCKIQAHEPERFNFNPFHHSVGLNTFLAPTQIVFFLSTPRRGYEKVLCK